MSPRVLAIDVTGAGGGAALLTPDGVTAAAIPAEVRRARSLVPSIQGLLAGAGLAPADLDLVACGVGPGSFTGIRIGIATAATLAYAAGLPVLDVGSLHGIAHNAPASAPRVLVALNARRGRVFCALFGPERELIGEYRHVDPASIEIEPDTFVLGDGRAPRFDAFPGTAEAPVRPDVVARIAAERFGRGEHRRPDELRPLYLRLSDPEIRRAQGEML